MLHVLLTPKYFLLLLFLSSAAYVQFRGKVRHKASRLIADHANVLAPSQLTGLLHRRRRREVPLEGRRSGDVR